MTDVLRCSFCGHSENEVEKFIQGPGVYICNTCVGLCNQILGTPTLTELERSDIIGAIVHLCLFHIERRKEAEQSVREYSQKPRTAKNKKIVAACRRVMEQHIEMLYQAGELAAKFGGRNGYPRPASPEKRSSSESGLRQGMER